MNRRERRAKDAKQSKIQNADDIPLARPPQDNQRKAKTLYELAAERQAQLAAESGSKPEIPTEDNVVNVAIGPNGEIKTLDGSALPSQQNEDINPWLDTLLLSVSLSMVHFTFEALTLHQYAEELQWDKVFWDTILQAFPILTLLIHFMHGHLVTIKTSKKISDAIGGLKQILFLLVANFAGCELVRITNTEGYMAVMKDAPSIGTVWVWSVIELGLLGAVSAVAGPAAYAWYNGYGIY